MVGFTPLLLAAMSWAHPNTDTKKGGPLTSRPGTEKKGRSVLGFDPPAVGDLAFIDSQAKATIGVGAGPRLENDRSAFLPIVRKWNQGAIVALLALRQLHHPTSSAAGRGPTAKVIEPILLKQWIMPAGTKRHLE
jgi:hypothetical protein